VKELVVLELLEPLERVRLRKERGRDELVER
jgi:hypothetical protein